MRYSLLAVALILIGAAMPQAAASTVDCLAVAPAATTCQAEVYFPTGAASFDDDVELVLDFVDLTINLYEKDIFFPGGYSAVSSFTCVTAVPDGCDGALVGPVGGVFLLVAEITGSSGGIAPEWGWSWTMPSATVGPAPCGGPPAAPCP